MGFGRAQARAGQLWQLPLLLFSISLFLYAVNLAVNSRAGATVEQQLALAANYLNQDRNEPASDLLKKLINSEKLSSAQEGAAYMLLGQSIQQALAQNGRNGPESHRWIIEYTRRAVELGIEADATVHQRLGESFEALGNYAESAEHYRSAAGLDPTHALKWQRKSIDLLLAVGNSERATEALEEFLKHEHLSPGERAWALGAQAKVLVDAGNYDEARHRLDEALKLSDEPADRGQFCYWLGYCLWKTGNSEEAERQFRAARDQLPVQHPLDGDAAFALGQIRQAAKDYAEAGAFYAAVLEFHPDAPVARPALAGRGVCRIASGSHEAGLVDLDSIVRYIREREKPSPRLVEQTLAALRLGGELLSAQQNYKGALELIADEQHLQPNPDREFFGRLGALYERRANQVEAGHELADEQQRKEVVRDCRTKAGDAFVAFARAMTLSDDKAFGEALWKAIELYEKAGDLPRTISALEMFVSQRPEDLLTPEALLKLGDAYHAVGLFDKAIAAYRRTQFQYPKSLAASVSGVPLARTYIAKGPDFYGKAEEVLRAVVENNPQITPEAREFREALFELANLYYRTGRFESGIARLEELTQRYPKDERMGQLLFLMADSYRKSAAALEEKSKPSKADGLADVAEAAAARKERLGRARDLFKRVIDYYRNEGMPTESDKLYMKLSYFYSADCVYDLGDYAEAIKLFDDAAFRYQDDPSALAAYVQIVNANVALGRIEEAKAANERAKWMLRRMPAESFADSTSFAMPRAAWDNWLRWAGQSGLWK